MTALLTLDQAIWKLGIGKPALLSAIERGDLIQEKMEGSRTRKYITTKSVDAWIARLNGDVESASPDTSEVVESLQRQISLGFHLKQLSDKLDGAISRMAGQQERDRRARLRIPCRQGSVILLIRTVITSTCCGAMTKKRRCTSGSHATYWAGWVPTCVRGHSG